MRYDEAIYRSLQIKNIAITQILNQQKPIRKPLCIGM